jgi:NitT/TauT family transport system substrate-binding protein
MKRGKMLGSLGMTVLFVMVVSFIVWSLPPTAVAGGVTPEKGKLIIGIPVPAASFFPTHAAEANGFFKEEGFTETKILAFRGNAPTVQALAAGTIDLCVASLHGLINTINSGQPFKGVWAGYTMPIFEWYSQTKYKSIAETKGASYGVSRYGSLTDSLTRYVLRKSGLDPEKDVKILPVGRSSTTLAALQSGRLDVGILSLPWTFTAAEKGLSKLLSQRDDIAPNYPTHIVYARKDFIAKNPNTIKAFLRATGRAMEWIKANPDKAAQLMSKKLKFRMKDSLPTLDYIKDGWHPDGRVPIEGMKVFWEISVRIGDVKAPWPDSKWLDESFLKTQAEWRK